MPIRNPISDENASPITEEALLIGLAIVIFAGLLMLVSSINQYVNKQYENLMKQLSQAILLSIYLLDYNATDLPTLDTYIASWPLLLQKVLAWLKTFFNYIVYAALLIGGIMIVWGAIEWATGYNEAGGKKSIIRGTFLVLLALAPVIAQTG